MLTALAALRALRVALILLAIYAATLPVAGALVTLGVAQWGIPGFPVGVATVVAGLHVAVRHARRWSWARLNERRLLEVTA